METGLTLLFHAKLQFLWVEAFLTIIFLINRMPSLVLKYEVPFVKLHGAPPDYNNLKVFGCRCYPYLKGQNKFSLKTYPCVFIGHSSLHKGYRCYHTQTKRVYVSRRIIYDELNMPYVQADQPSCNLSSPYIATFLEFFSIVQKKADNLGEVFLDQATSDLDQAAPTHLMHELDEHATGTQPLIDHPPVPPGSPIRSTSDSASESLSNGENKSETNDAHIVEDLLSDDQETYTRNNKKSHEPNMFYTDPQGIQIENNANELPQSAGHEPAKTSTDGHHMVTRHKAKQMSMTHTSLSVVKYGTQYCESDTCYSTLACNNARRD